MQQSEHYIRAMAFSDQLEQSLLKCDEVSRSLEKACKQVFIEIEEHFDLCFSLLHARRATLHSDLVRLVQEQQENLVNTKAILQKSKESCAEILNVAPAVYKHNRANAEKMWKEAIRFSCPVVLLSGINMSFDHSFLTEIENHGRFSLGTNEHPLANTPLIAKKVTTIAGSFLGYTDGKGENAKFNRPRGLCVNPNDQCIYVCDSKNNSIRKVTVQGDVITFVQNNPKLSKPTGIVMNHKENVFLVINKGNHTITKISQSGSVSNFAGKKGYPGNQDGIGVNASFNNPKGIAIDQNTGNLFISDFNNSSIRKVSSQGEVSTITETHTNFVSALFSSLTPIYPRGLAFDPSDQCLLVCDFFNNEIIRVSMEGAISSVAKIERPTSIVINESHNIIVFSADGLCVYQIIKLESKKYEVKKIAGSGKPGSQDGEPLESSFSGPCALAFGEHANICFVAEFIGCKIREIQFAN